MNETTISVCAKLYKARASMRSFWGDKYAAKVTEYKAHIEKWMEPGDDGPIAATMRLVKRLQNNVPFASAMPQALLLAACVEMIEPTKP